MNLAWVPPLLGVLLGGLLSVWVSKTSAQRAARRDALGALASLAGTQQGIIPSERESSTRLDVRLALLEAGVPWAYVELLDNITDALLMTEHKFTVAMNSDDPHLVKWVSQIKHPSRATRRPLVVYAKLVETVIAECLEQPLRARLFRPLRRHQLRQALEEIATDNELTHLPDKPITFPDGTTTRALDAIAKYLVWPTRKLPPVRDPGRAVHQPESYWPKVATREPPESEAVVQPGESEGTDPES